MIDWAILYQDIECVMQLLQQDNILKRINDNWEYYNYLLLLVIFFGILFLRRFFQESKMLLDENEPKTYLNTLAIMLILIFGSIYINYQAVDYSKAYLVTLEECELKSTDSSTYILQGDFSKRELITSVGLEVEDIDKGRNLKKYPISPNMMRCVQTEKVSLILVGKIPIGVLYPDGYYYLDY